MGSVRPQGGGKGLRSSPGHRAGGGKKGNPAGGLASAAASQVRFSTDRNQAVHLLEVDALW